MLFFDAVAQVFANIAGEKGLRLYADDLHWADRGTLWLLSHLLRQLRKERVLIVGAYRGTELDRARPLAKALVDWADTESRVSRLWVGPMYIEVLLAVGKRDKALEHLRVCQELVAVCQSPRFSREAERLAVMINSQQLNF